MFYAARRAPEERLFDSLSALARCSVRDALFVRDGCDGAKCTAGDGSGGSAELVDGDAEADAAGAWRRPACGYVFAER